MIAYIIKSIGVFEFVNFFLDADEAKEWCQENGDRFSISIYEETNPNGELFYYPGMTNEQIEHINLISCKNYIKTSKKELRLALTYIERTYPGITIEDLAIKLNMSVDRTRKRVEWIRSSD